MDPIRNPFSPGAGSPPPELVGRSDILEQARILLGRIALFKPEKSLLLTGLRGVGKTVLLNEIEHLAVNSGYRTILVEAHEKKSLGLLLIPKLRTLLFELNRIEGASEKVRRGLAILRSFIGTIKISVGDVDFGIDIDPEKGVADSGDIELDLPDLIIAVADAAKDRNIPFAILIDEVQYFNKEELSSLIMTMHKIQQKNLPVVLIGAGLPILPGLAGDSKSYAERLFNFPNVGALSKTDACKALQDPVKQEGAIFEDVALEYIYNLTRGYPYFLQEWGYQAWNHAQSPQITKGVVEESNQMVVKRLDSNFFRVRFDRLTNGEKKFLRAMAELGLEGTYRISDVANKLGIAINQIGPVRSNIIKKGMIYSPAHGEIAFTVPLFSEFMRRAMPNDVA